jgi:hypothetical protein
LLSWDFFRKRKRLDVPRWLEIHGISSYAAFRAHLLGLGVNPPPIESAPLALTQKTQVEGEDTPPKPTVKIKLPPRPTPKNLTPQPTPKVKKNVTTPKNLTPQPTPKVKKNVTTPKSRKPLIDVKVSKGSS